MRRVIYAVLIVILFTAPVRAGDIQPHVTAYGTAVIAVVPDEMRWYLKIENRGPEIEAMAKRHSAIVSDVIAFLDDTGIAEEDIQTSMMQFGEQWEYQKDRRVKTGYYASSQITFKLSNLSKYQVLWEGLSQRPGASIQNISYGCSGRMEIQERARRDALLAAEEKAMAMAAALRVRLGSPLVLEEALPRNHDLMPNTLMANESAFKSGSQPVRSIALGKIEIKSRVKVIYRLISD